MRSRIDERGIGRHISEETSFVDGKEAALAWLSRLSCVSLAAGIASLIALHPRAVLAGDEKRPAAVPTGIKNLNSRLNRISSNCSKPGLLRRQSEYRLPAQRSEFNMLNLLAGSDSCPGTPIPAGTYTAASPYTDSGSTIGANNTVTGASPCFYNYYAYSSNPGPDHVYSFTLTARGPAPQILVSTTSPNFQMQLYILNGITLERCPLGSDRYVNNCLTMADSTIVGNESINPDAMNNLPLNVPLHLFIDSAWISDPQNAGPYTIRFQDVTIADSVFPPANDAPLDINGDGRSDYVVARNTGGGTSGQMTWLTRTSSDQFLPAVNWGLATDKFVPADYDGDGRYDIVIWRPGPQGRFYIIQSRTNTIRIDDFGQAGDQPVVADYTADGFDDLAVYRDGATPGSQSYWYYRSAQSPAGFTVVAWGRHGDRPAPGTYDGVFADFVVQRAEGPLGRFYIRYSHNFLDSFVFGSANDKLVPGDYDADGLIDIAVVRPGEDGIFVWDFEPSSTAGVTTVRNFWGVAATDILTPGDYDGNGQMDLSVWRPGSPGTFYSKSPTGGGNSIINWGQAGDLPVASENSR